MTQQHVSPAQQKEQQNSPATSTSGRERTDSEKENRPIECNRNIQSSVQQQILEAKLGDVKSMEKKIKQDPVQAEASKPDIKDEDPSIIMVSKG